MEQWTAVFLLAISMAALLSASIGLCMALAICHFACRRASIQPKLRVYRPTSGFCGGVVDGVVASIFCACVGY